MRAIPLEQHQHDAIASRYVKLCLDHVVELDTCPEPHAPAKPRPGPPGPERLEGAASWFVWDLQAQRVLGGICTPDDGDTGGVVEEDKVERARALFARPVARRNTMLHEVTREVEMGRRPNLTEEQKAEIRRRVAAGEKKAAIAEDLGVLPSTITRVLAPQVRGARKRQGQKKPKPAAKRATPEPTPSGFEDVLAYLRSSLEQNRAEGQRIERAIEALEG